MEKDTEKVTFLEEKDLVEIVGGSRINGHAGHRFINPGWTIKWPWSK